MQDNQFAIKLSESQTIQSLVKALTIFQKIVGGHVKMIIEMSNEGAIVSFGSEKEREEFFLEILQKVDLFVKEQKRYEFLQTLNPEEASEALKICQDLGRYFRSCYDDEAN